MGKNEGQIPGLGNADPLDVVCDIRCSNKLYPNESREFERQVAEDDEIDDNYQWFLLGLLPKEEISEPHKNKRKDKEFESEPENDCSAEDDDDEDPQFKLFLQHLKPHGKSYVLEYEKDGVPLVLKYEDDMGSDEECDPEPRRKSKKSLEKTVEGSKPGKLSDKVDDVENAKGSPNDIVQVAVQKGYAEVNEKIDDGVNDHVIESGRKLRSSMREKVGIYNQIPAMESTLGSKNTEKLSGRKPRNESDKVENVDIVAPDPDYLDFCQNAKLDVEMEKGKNVIHQEVNGVDDDLKKEKSRFLNEKPAGVENHQPIKYSLANKKNEGLTKKKSRNEADKPENVKITRNDVGPDPDYLHFHRNVKIEDDDLVYMQKGHDVVDGKIHGVDDQMKKKKKGMSMLGVETRRKHDKAYTTSVKKAKSVTRRKSRNDIANRKISGVNDQKEEHQKKSKKAMKEKVGKSTQILDVENQRKQHDPRPSSGKKSKSPTLRRSRNENDNDNDNVEIEKCSASEFRKMKAAKCFVPPKNVDEVIVKKEIPDETDFADVEILDRAACPKEVMSNTFVPTKTVNLTGKASKSAEYRERVLNFLKRPFDKEEYAGRQEQVKSYFNYYPDVGKKLKKYRHYKWKRLVILRGFFYWLQNVTQEGAFKPWKDRECLTVVPDEK